MNPADRTEKQALAFLDHVASTAGYKLRPAGYLTLQNTQLLGMVLGTGQEATAALDGDQMRDQVNAYLFLQAAPLPLVARAVRGYRAALKQKPQPEAWEDFLVEQVAPFLDTLSPVDQGELQAQLEALGEVDAARIVAKPPPGHKQDRPDPNS